MTAQDHAGTPPPQVMPSIPGYEILRELGRGGMGVVYKARKLDADRVVALKMTLGARRPRFLEFARFCLEAQAVACLSHPNIVQIHDIGEFGGYPYFTLEYASGGSLAEKIRGQPQPPRWSAGAVKILAEAIHHAHRRDILHRDLKPGNILIMENGTLKITDFGLVKFSRSVWEVSKEFETCSIEVLHRDIVPLSVLWREEVEGMMPDFGVMQARKADLPVTGESFEESELDRLCQEILGPFGPEAVTRGLSTLKELKAEVQRQAGSAPPEGLPRLDDLTRPGDIMGSPHYMAPEQASGKNSLIGPQTDVYSLGAILYHMLTGRRPFEGSTTLELLERVRTRRPEPIEPRMAHDLEAIVWRCMEKRIEQRYRSAGELADDLQRFVDGYATLATERGIDEPATPVVQEGSTAGLPPFSARSWPTSTSLDSQKTKSWWQFWK
jgi:serine/threonine protein kinase